jgi:hypothetical protein
MILYTSFYHSHKDAICSSLQNIQKPLSKFQTLRGFCVGRDTADSFVNFKVVAIPFVIFHPNVGDHFRIVWAAVIF